MRCDGSKVARLRRELGITQLDLADKAKVSKTTIERIERGIAVDYQSIHQIAPVLGVGFNDLILPEEGDDAGPEAAFVPLTSLGSVRELMDFLLRCDTAAIDLVSILTDRQYAFVDGEREEAIPGGTGSWPTCAAAMVARRGLRIIHHWAHRGRRHDADVSS